MKFKCSCCGYYTLDEGGGNYEICPECFWEDDPMGSHYPELVGGANGVSLIAAQENYRKFGACEERFSDKVRMPTEDEIS